MKKMLVPPMVLLAMLFIFSMGCELDVPEEPYPPSNQPLDGKGLVAERCTTCHNMDRIERRFGQDLAYWESTVDRMLGKRNMLNDAERKAVLDYLIDP